MTIIIHNTTKIVHINGVPARVWEGESATGIPLHCFITRIAVAKKEDNAEFERELQEQSPPSAEMEVIPLRMII